MMQILTQFRGALWGPARCLINSAQIYSIEVREDDVMQTLAHAVQPLAVAKATEIGEDISYGLVNDCAREIARTYELRETTRAKLCWQLHKRKLKPLLKYILTPESALALNLQRTEQSFYGSDVPDVYANLLLGLLGDADLIKVEAANKLITSLPWPMFELVTS